jgi:hypothetical protein
MTEVPAVAEVTHRQADPRATSSGLRRAMRVNRPAETFHLVNFAAEAAGEVPLAHFHEEAVDD